MFRVATWNVNSLRVRLPHVLDWLKQHQPDVLALQELKLPDESFPLAAIQEAGYTAVFSGQKTYNGVATLTRQSATEKLTDIANLQDPQRRILGVTVNDIRVINLYIPNGESVNSEKYKYKLDWLVKVTEFLHEEVKRYAQLLVLGDFNIAPEECDVHDPQAWQGQVLFSQPEREAFQAMLKLGLVDCFRLHEQGEKSFSWWDYRLNAFKRNMGMRIDHILASHSLAAQCRRCYIDKTPRGLERPSDHTPVVAEFDFL